MSRSYKKHPYYTDGTNGRVIQKKWANKKVRKYTKEIENGRSYKKLFCSWNIHDYKYRQTWQEAKEQYENSEFFQWNQKRYPTLKDFYKYWIKYHKNK